MERGEELRSKTWGPICVPDRQHEESGSCALKFEAAICALVAGKWWGGCRLAAGEVASACTKRVA